MSIQSLLDPIKSRINTGILVATGSLLLTLIGSGAGVFDKANLMLGDMRTGIVTSDASGETVVVGIDQQSLAHFGGWPIPRNHMGSAVDNLIDAGAERIYIDSHFASESREENDATLEQALERAGSERVALPIVTMRGKLNDEGQAESIRVVSIPRFAQHAADVSSDLPFDSDGRVRAVGRDPFGKIAERPTVADWLVNGSKAVPRETPIDFGINLKSIPEISYKDIVAGNFDAELVRGKQVVIGLVAERVTQPIVVPRYGEMERAHFLALATETLSLGNVHAQASFWSVFGCTAVCVALLGWLCSRLGIIGGGLISIATMVGLFYAGIQLQQNYHVVFPLGHAFGAILLTYVGTLVATHPSFQHTRQACLSLVDKVDYGLAKLFHSGVDSIITFTPEGEILTINETAEKMFGIKAEDVLGKQLSTVLPDSAEALLRSAGGQQPGRLEATLGGDSGHEKHVDLAFNAMPSEEGWVGYASIRDISEMKAREDELKRQASHDAMTGLPNRAAFERHLDATLRFASEIDRPFAVFLMDLNKFKKVNDTIGHHIGDALLIEVAKRFQDTVRSSDFVARLGGDEFTVVLAPPTEQEGAEDLAKRLVESLADLTELEGHTIETGTSVGVALYPDHGESAEQLMQVADEAMYEAKREGDGFKVAELPTTAGA